MGDPDWEWSGASYSFITPPPVNSISFSFFCNFIFISFRINHLIYLFLLLSLLFCSIITIILIIYHYYYYNYYYLLLLLLLLLLLFIIS